jgi:hypothetical protein
MKKIILTTLIAILCLLISSCKTTPTSLDEGGFGAGLGIEELESDSINISISVPESWEESSSSYLGTEIRHYRSPLETQSDIFAESLSVTTEKLEEETNLDEYVNKNVENLKLTFSDFEIVSPVSDEKIGEYDGKVVSFSYTMGTYKIVIEEAFVMKDGNMYIIMSNATTDSYENYKDVFKTARDSFKIN